MCVQLKPKQRKDTHINNMDIDNNIRKKWNKLELKY